MNERNNFETLDHYQGYIWISKKFKTENRGNICVRLKGDFSVVAYISPDMLKNKKLEKVIYDSLEAHGTLWMLEEDTSITCSLCGKTFAEEKVNIVDYEDDVCVDCEKTLLNTSSIKK